MKIQRTIPPAAAPLGLKSLVSGATALLSSRKRLERLERQLKDYFGVRHVFLLSSGRAALFMILRALGKIAPARRKVLIPAYTCYSVPSAIVKAGLEVSLCDIDRTTFDFDGRQVRDAAGDDTLCIVPNHLFGIPSGLDLLKGIGRERGVFIVEDAAQAMGGSYHGRKLGAIGDAGFFSLGRGKNISCGSGGVIITNNDRIAAAIEEDYRSVPSPSSGENIRELLQAFLTALFIHPSLYWLPAGLSFLGLGQTLFDPDFPVQRLSGVKAGLLLHWQARLETSNRIRRQNSARLRLLDRKGVPCPFPAALLRFPVLAENRTMRDHMYAALNGRGLGVSRMYPASVNQIKALRDRFASQSFPTAEDVAERILTLPTHELLSPDDEERLLSAVSAFLPLLNPGREERTPSSRCRQWEGLVRS